MHLGVQVRHRLGNAAGPTPTLLLRRLPRPPRSSQCPRLTWFQILNEPLPLLQVLLFPTPALGPRCGSSEQRGFPHTGALWAVGLGTPRGRLRVRPDPDAPVLSCPAHTPPDPPPLSRPSTLSAGIASSGLSSSPLSHDVLLRVRDPACLLSVPASLAQCLTWKLEHRQHASGELIRLLVSRSP